MIVPFVRLWCDGAAVGDNVRGSSNSSYLHVDLAKPTRPSRLSVDSLFGGSKITFMPVMKLAPRTMPLPSVR